MKNDLVYVTHTKYDIYSEILVYNENSTEKKYRPQHIIYYAW